MPRAPHDGPHSGAARQATATASPTYTMADLPGAWPLLGHMPALARDPLAFLAGLSDHGDLVRIKVGSQTAYAVCHPELVQRFLVEDRTFDKGGPVYDRLREITGDGLGTCPATAHRRQRRMIQPLFHRDAPPSRSPGPGT
ncbi:cytochrome P450 [Kitasatospora sp. NPDC028055]|uniref:cytochrome P450 n=1 Tax=Kitasatospora sp. NPDC028055 TaxID=3155653 RepID=UPI0033D135D1